MLNQDAMSVMQWQWVKAVQMVHAMPGWGGLLNSSTCLWACVSLEVMWA